MFSLFQVISVVEALCIAIIAAIIYLIDAKVFHFSIESGPIYERTPAGASRQSSNHLV